ncbi:MAG: family 16 glycosylhydrolase [Ignavibacteriales bacterium]|nr:MAG: family 16 glycosylhydrolase [Ignavibacteriales bacterium]
MNRKLPLLLILITCLISQTISKDYKGAEYRTKAAYTYGRFEANYKSINKEGVLATFFTYHEQTNVNDWNEIDFEILGRYENDVQLNPITRGQVNHVRHQLVNFNPHLDYHTYAFEWTPTYVAWFIDGVEVHRQTGPHIEGLNLPQKIMMNVWNPIYSSWVGTWNPDVLPAFAYYDWVSYYSYTPGSGNYGTGNNFTHSWTDNLDSWDQVRWDKATHTFNGNQCDFLPANIVFQDGKMILCLTNNTNTGFVDITPPKFLWARASGNKVKILFTEEVDETTAENTGNYIIPNVTVQSATLLENLKTVELVTSGIDPSTQYNCIVMGVKDRAPQPNTMQPMAKILIHPSALSFPVKINVGGTASLGYLADQEYGIDKEYGYLDGTGAQNSAPISGTDEDVIYNTDRYGLVTYKIRVPNGEHRVKLMMAETYFNEAGKRVFDIYIEGNQVADNVDLYQLVGKNAAYELVVNSVTVTDEELEIFFGNEIDNALINGIVIENISTGINDEEIFQPKEFRVEQNYPNPFNGTTIIKYYLPYTDELTFNIFDVLGNKIYSENIGSIDSGENHFVWNGLTDTNQPVSSGVYFYYFTGREISQTKKLVLLN